MRSSKLNQTSKEELTQLYWASNLNLREIGELLNANSTDVLKRMQKLEIPRRTLQESNRISACKRWLDPEYRAKQLIVRQSEEYKQRQSVAVKRSRTPEVKAKIRQKLIETYKSPELRASIGGKTRQYWAEHRDEIVEKVRAGVQQGTHDRWIQEEIKNLTEDGYTVIPIGLREFPEPDIIAMKEGKVFAIEVEGEKPKPSRYYGYPSQFFNDIIWIIRGRRKRKPH